ncbi:MAG: sodium/proton antiporter, NhaD family [Bacteroidetes bacterium]|nr:sodium/proton antiporter, NhaD family [Bacteroidota bacterium]
MELIIITFFILGYTAIALEHSIKIDKAASALITGVLCWVIYIVFVPDKHIVNEQLTGHLGEVSGILFFLLGAMTIVELIDAHEGFNIITSRITSTNKRSMLWIIGFITFFLSAVLDNLTTTIVIISLLKKLIKKDEDRLFYAGIVIIAANAGGAWSPIGDVTTTMLWIGGQVTAVNIIAKLLLPSLVCLTVPLIFMSFRMKGDVSRPSLKVTEHSNILPQKYQYIVLISGILVLISVPVFKTTTHLPPYMGMLFGLAILWIVTSILHKSDEHTYKNKFSVAQALRNIDTPSILFFLGILISISALQSVGILTHLSHKMSTYIANENIIVMAIGLLSSIVDNVPLVAATQGMYSLVQYPADHYFWEFLAYATGTGGSALVIGSAAGVVAMGMEKISFMWYLRKISWLALIGFFSGAVVYILQDYFLH